MSFRTSRRRRRTLRRVRRGFTLIELLVTIAIIATLAAIIAPSLFSNVGDAKVDAAKSQIQIIALALDAYRVDNDQYPTTEQGIEALRSIPATGDALTNWRGPYLRQVIPLDPWGNRTCTSRRASSTRTATTSTHSARPANTDRSCFTVLGRLREAVERQASGSK